MPPHNYIVSAHKATAIADAVVGNFTGEDDLNLIFGKVNRLEVFVVGAEGLKSLREITVFGRIVSIKLFRVKGETRDSLLVYTAKHHVAILQWDKEKGEITTRAAGTVADRVGRPSDFGAVVCVHSSGLIAMRIYDGTLKIIQWSDNKDLKGFNVRFEDLNIIDLEFLHTPGDQIKIAYISQDASGRHLKIVELSLMDKELRTCYKQDNIESEANIVIPVPNPYGGVIIVGHDTLLYNRGHAGDDENYLSYSPPLMNQTQFMCYAKIDSNGQRYLLADDHGRLFMLLLDIDGMDGGNGNHAVKEIKLELLGETSIAECVVYLDNGVVFVGSRLGDSQLIKLTQEPNAENSFIVVMETYTNLAPIRDMTMIETDGQTQLITCSGAYKEGSLRVIRNGIGIDEAASVDLPGVKGLYSLHVGSALDNYLVVSLAEETHILQITGEELEDTSLLDLDTTERTLWAGNILNSETILQVTGSGMRLTKEGTETVHWKPGDAVPIGLVSVNKESGQILAAAGAHIYYLQCVDMAFELVGHKEMNQEVACLDISCIDDTKISKLASIGLWTEMSIVLMTLPDLNEVTREKLPGDVLPRSILLTKMEEIIYLMVALGDGTLYYFTIDLTSAGLSSSKKAALGTQPPSLHLFETRGMSHVFACSDRPAVIFSSNRKLVFSNVNLKQVTQICSLNSETYRDSLVMSDGETLVIGTVDDIQKLHIRTVPLGESVRRIAHQKETGTLGILVNREEMSNRVSVSRMATSTSSSKPTSGVRSTSMAGDNSESDVHSFVVLDQNTFEILHSHELGKNEEAISIISTRLGDDPNVYYVVGTAMVYNDETEAKSGRLLVFEMGQNEERTKMRLVHEKEIKGSAFSMESMGGKLLVAINSSVRLFEWTVDNELRLECSHFNYITALYLKVKGDHVLVGDMMRSVNILSYKSMESTFEEAAKDYRGMWTTAVELIDAETALAAESSYNLYTAERDRGATANEERQKLVETGMFYLGEMVNVFRHGTLVSSHVDNSLPLDKPILFGTVEGSIGLIVQLTPEYFKFLHDIEKSVAKATHNCLRIDHSVYRQFQSSNMTEKSYGFIDGDLVEALMDMTRDQAKEVLSGIKLPGESEPSSAEDVLKIIEDLSRIH